MIFLEKKKSQENGPADRQKFEIKNSRHLAKPHELLQALGRENYRNVWAHCREGINFSSVVTYGGNASLRQCNLKSLWFFQKVL